MQITINERSIIVAAEGQVWCDLAGEAAILDVDSGVYYGLNQVGTSIWNLIHKPVTVAAVRDALVREYDVDLMQCENDLIELLHDLADKGLIEVRADGQM